MPRTRALDPVEIRVLGALMEKERTTPETYPLTVNALIVACNQKTNREPITELSETQVVDTLDRLRQDVLAWRTESSRAERWKHCLDRRWHLNPAGQAVMTMLLLRGPQTLNELRTRTERLHAFASLEEVEATLRRLAEGPDPLVRELPRRPGQREARWMHLAAGEAATEAAIRNERPAEQGPVEPAGPFEAGQSEPPARPSAAAAMAPARQAPGLAERLARLESAVEALAADVAVLKQSLGV